MAFKAQNISNLDPLFGNESVFPVLTEKNINKILSLVFTSHTIAYII